MKMDRVSLEIAIADGTFACHEINKASTSDEDGGLSSAAKIHGIMREMHLLLAHHAQSKNGFTEIDLQAAYLVAEISDLRLTSLIAEHGG
jgi:hypothetical protein